MISDISLRTANTYLPSSRIFLMTSESDDDKGLKLVMYYSKVSIIRPGCSRLLEFEKKIVQEV